MMDGMANHATRIYRHIEREGHEVVEQFIEVCLSLENLIDPHSAFMQRQPTPKPKGSAASTRDEAEQRGVRRIRGSGIRR